MSKKESNIKKSENLEQNTKSQLNEASNTTNNYNNTASTSTSKDWANLTEEEELVSKETLAE
ncbi:9949_t:CDS:2, partial [Racocetra fulgida]